MYILKILHFVQEDNEFYGRTFTNITEKIIRFVSDS